MVSEYGGYHQWEHSKVRGLADGCAWFVSARSALRHCLETNGVKRIAVPDYICGAIDDAVAQSGAGVCRYELDQSLLPASRWRPGEIDALLYPNYFGLCSINVETVRQNMPDDAILILDNAQALFAGRGVADWAIYSPRKFVGLPDGGLLSPDRGNEVMPIERDMESVHRLDHLCLRATRGAKAGYEAFCRAEQSLGDTRPRRASLITECMAGAISYEEVRERRCENFDRMHAQMGGSNRLQLTRRAADVPLYYPYWCAAAEGAVLRSELITRSVFVPEIWTEVREKARPEGFSAALSRELVCLPIDQRMTAQDVDVVASIVTEIIDDACTP